MRLYRAVSEAESQQVVRTKKFHPAPNSYEEGRFFAESVTDAKRWANAFGRYRIITAEFTDDVAEAMMRWEMMDGIGPARFARWVQLAAVIIIEEVIYD